MIFANPFFTRMLKSFTKSDFVVQDTKRSLLVSNSAKKIRRKIEELDNRLNLPVAKKSLGVFEGEHPSNHNFGNGDLVDIHSWQPGDEARMMNWKASARLGEPMVSSRERNCSSKTWILVDSSVNMNASCSYNGLNEYLYEAASNSACFFASLSIKRNDSLNCVLFDGNDIIKIPSSRNLPDFERNLDKNIYKTRKKLRDTNTIINFANSINQSRGLIVIITDEYAISSKHFDDLQKISRLHSLIVVTICPINPFNSYKVTPIIDGTTMREIPAFLKDDSCAKEVNTHRAFVNNALHEILNNTGSSLIRGSSSEQIFHSSTKFISKATLQSMFSGAKSNKDLRLS